MAVAGLAAAVEEEVEEEGAATPLLLWEEEVSMASDEADAAEEAAGRLCELLLAAALAALCSGGITSLICSDLTLIARRGSAQGRTEQGERGTRAASHSSDRVEVSVDRCITKRVSQIVRRCVHSRMSSIPGAAAFLCLLWRLVQRSGSLAPFSNRAPPARSSECARSPLARACARCVC